MATNREGDCYKHAGFWEGGGAKGWSYDVYPIRNGEHWQADLVVDRYLPGRCGWEIRGSAMIMVEPRDAGEGDMLGAGTRLVVADTRTVENEAPRCKPNHPRCSEERSRRLSNSDDSIPVQVKCKRVAPEKRGYGRTFFFCNRLPEHKITHELRAHTRSIRIDLYDLDHEEVI